MPIVEAYAAPAVSLLQHGRTLDDGSVIDLSHEALMRQWKRLSRWVDTEARRAADYRRWTERESDHRHKQGGLLEGAALARAVEWLGGQKEDGRDAWRPTAAWAARYATTADGPDAFEELARTVAFIEQSAEHVRQQEQEEIDRRERERAATLERAPAAERAAKQAQRRAVQRESWRSFCSRWRSPACTSISARLARWALNAPPQPRRWRRKQRRLQRGRQQKSQPGKLRSSGIAPTRSR